jgi:hypothetical protein
VLSQLDASRGAVCGVTGLLCPAVPGIACGRAILGPLAAGLEAGAGRVTLRVCRADGACDAGPFKVGEAVVFDVAAAFAGRAVLFDVDALGVVTQILPNALAPAGTAPLMPGAVVRVPDAAAGFAIRARPPVGRGCAVAIVAPAGAGALSLLLASPPSKGLAVVPRSDVAAAGAAAGPGAAVGFAAYEIVE